MQLHEQVVECTPHLAACAVHWVEKAITHHTALSSLRDMATSTQSNRFSDASPSFPYQSSEASHYLGIPDSPVVHLAITRLAERLLLTTFPRDEPSEMARIAALRCASYGVLMRHSFEAIEYRFGVYIDLPRHDAAFDRAEKANSVDWMGEAISQLESEGVDIASGVRQQATPYGWKEAK